MDPITLIFGIVAALALGISVVTLVLAWGWSRTPPEYSTLSTRVSALDQATVDLEDRLAQWMRRESVRKMREGKEAKQAANGQMELIPGETPKAALRRRVFGLRGSES